MRSLAFVRVRPCDWRRGREGGYVLTEGATAPETLRSQDRAAMALTGRALWKASSFSLRVLADHRRCKRVLRLAKLSGFSDRGGRINAFAPAESCARAAPFESAPDDPSNR